MTKQLFAAFSANFSEIFPPAEKKAIFTFEKSKLSKFDTSYSLPLKFIFFTTLLDDATKCRLSKESSFFSRTSNIFLYIFKGFRVYLRNN